MVGPSNFFVQRRLASYIVRKNYYEIIGVESNATKLEIRDAFLKKTKELHPDQARKPVDKRLGFSRTSTTEQFMLVKEAYDCLRNEEKRREYDQAYSSEGGFCMEATAKTKEMTSSSRNRQRAEWSGDIIPDLKKSNNTSFSHFRNPEEEFEREKRKNRMLTALGCIIICLVGANVIYVRKLQSDRLK